MTKILIGFVVAMVVFVAITVGIPVLIPGIGADLGLKAAAFIFSAVIVGLIFSRIEEDQLLIIVTVSAANTCLILVFIGSTTWIFLLAGLVIFIAILFIKEVKENTFRAIVLFLLTVVLIFSQLLLYHWLA